MLVAVGLACGSGGSVDPLTQEVTDEPVFDSASATRVLQDDMDGYTTATAMGATPAGTAPRIVPNPSPVATSQGVNTSTNQVITPGRGGAGKALRMGYTGVYQQGATFYTLNQPNTPILATHHFQYWARINAPNLSSTLAVKWFEAWHTGHDRVQWNTHTPSRAHRPAQHTIWQVYDQGRETPGQGDQPIGPYFNDLNDNRWHRYTFSYRPNSSGGARDGFARMWVDGKKIIDISAATMNVTPAGGDKPWCTSADVDALAVNEGITNLVWGSTQTTTTPAWTYDIDDLVWWRT